MTVIGIASPIGAAAPRPVAQQPVAQPPPQQPQFAQPPQYQYPQPQPAPNPEDEPKFARASHPGFAPAPPPPGTSPPVGRKMLNQTMVGVGSLPGAQNANAPAAAAPRAQNIPKGTLFGVAVPGVAPTHDAPRVLGQQQPFQSPPHFQAPPPFQQQAPYAPRAYDSLPPPPKPSRAPAIVLALVAFVGVLGALIYVFVLRPSGPPPLTSAVEGDWNAPKLVVKCATCADGSTIDLGDKNATFAAGAATIALNAKDIKAGRNVFKGKVVPKGKSPRDVELDVLVPYLVRTSVLPLEKGEQHIDVVFDLADTVKAVVVDGEKLTGKTHAVKIPPPEGDARAFDKTVSYEVQPKEGAPIKGSLKLSIPYAPLRLGLPGRRAFAIGGELEVSGHTSAGATLTIGEQTLTADESGIFKGKVKVAEDASEIAVRAHAGKLAARTVTVPIAHAKDAGEIAKTLKAEAKTPFEKIAEKPDEHLGAAVDVKIVVAQTKEEDGRAVAVGDQKCAAAGEGQCPVVRVLLPPGATVSKGDVIEVLGVVARGVPMAKGTAVEIDASVLVSTK
jgi:hypothetical protein